MRLFIAIEIPNDIKEFLYQLTSLSTSLDGVSIVKKENFHITLKFLGEVEESLIPDIIDTLKKISNEFSPFALKISHPGAFPDKSKPRVIWIGTEDAATLIEIVKRIENEMEYLGFKKEERKFKSHITLARVKNYNNGKYFFERVIKKFSQNPLKLEFQVKEFVLMKSTLTPSGSIYDVLQRFPLIK